MNQNGISALPEQASTMAPSIDGVYLFICAITILFTVLIYVLVVFFAVKYRKSPTNTVATPIEGNHKLETIWILLPTIICMIMFVWGTNVYFKTTHIPKDAVQYYGTGKQWMWKFQHPNGKREINDLHVPINTPIQISLTSEDVIHSFYVPAFRVKKDVLPGRYTGVWFTATKPGVYHLFCAEYCGTKHSQMIGSVIALEKADYEAWLNDGLTVKTAEQRGAKVFTDFKCSSCHSDQNSALGPSLSGLYGSEVMMQSGRMVKADDNYIRESILFPNKNIVKGYSAVMPTFHSQLSEDQIIDLIAYVKTLKNESVAQ